MTASGAMIVLDGPDGCGKTTQVKLLSEALRERGHEVVQVRDPGGTSVGDRIRRILLSPTSGDISGRAELLLYMASRAELTARIIAPALTAGKVVVADRFYSASVAYQGVGRGLGVKTVLTLARFACRKLEPTLTLILDMDPMDAMRRRGDGEADRIESRSVAYHQRVRQGFLDLAESFPDAVKTIDARQSVEAVHARIMEEVARVL